MRPFLFILLLFVSVTAILSGSAFITRPDGSLLNLSVRLLQYSSFKNFMIPGLLLFIVVGGISTIALSANIIKSSKRYKWAMASAVVLCGWIIIQMILIQFFSWLHGLYLTIAVLIFILAYLLNKKYITKQA